MRKNIKKLKTQEKSNIKTKLENKHYTRPDKIKKYYHGDYFSRFSIQFWKEFFKKSFKKRSMFFVIMQLRNGKYDMFTVATDKREFAYKSGSYFIDSDMIREDVHTGLNTLYYHQDVSVPFKINVDLAGLSKDLELNHKNIIKAINPSSLKSFIHSEVIEKVMKGQELTNEMKFIKMITVLNLLVAVAVLGVVAKSMGWI